MKLLASADLGVLADASMTASLMTGPTSVLSLAPSPSSSFHAPPAAVEVVVADRAHQTRGGGAALPAGPEGGPHNGVEREVEIGILRHHDRVLTAELEAHPLQVFAAQVLISMHRVGEPVKLMRLTSGCSTMAFPTSSPDR